MISANIDRNPDGIDELIITFSGIEGLYIYSFTNNIFSRVVTVSPSRIVAADITYDGNIELAMAFEGYGVYLAGYEPAGEIQKTENTKYGLFDLTNHTPIAGNRWTTSKSDNKGLRFTRITHGTPDEGHDIGVGDITLGFGKEIFITYLGYTYYYSYDSDSWAVLVYAPLKRIISSTFTGHVKDDLIVCETTTGNIYLYKSKSRSWELLVYGGDSDAMAPVR